MVFATLDSLVDLVNGKSKEGAWSAVLIGKSGDHNGAFGNFRHTKSSDILPIEECSIKDIQDRVAALQSIGIDTINRLTIAGHGDYNGLLLSSGHRLPRNVSKLKEASVHLFNV